MTDVDFRPSGPVRSNHIYVSWQLFKALGYVARKSDRTREKLVELVLRTFVAQEHPDILAWLKQREDEEQAFIKNLTPSVARETKQEKFQPTTEDQLT